MKKILILFALSFITIFIIYFSTSYQTKNLNNEHLDGKNKLTPSSSFNKKESITSTSSDIKEKIIKELDLSLEIKNKTTLKTFNDDKYKVSFQYPEKFVIIPENDCSRVLLENSKEENCLLSLSIYPLNVNKKYIPPASFWLIKDLTSVNIYGQTVSVFYDKQSKSWVEVSSIDKKKLSIYSFTYQGKPILKAQNGGSHGWADFYIIPDYKKNIVAIFSFIQEYRLRCDLIEDENEKRECLNYLNSIIQQFGEKEKSKQSYYAEGWLPQEFFKNIYSEAESIVKSLSF
ncbi:hypothetical protein HRbin35_00188 [bacterium HR35]|nr:hypothetical protein HRbin35_00188 [bacterium HR35]